MVAAAPFLLIAAVAVSAVGAGIQASARNKVLEQQADLAEARALQETLRGKEEGNAVRRASIRALTTAAAQGAAGGIDITSGPTDAIFQEILSDANRQQRIVRANARIGALSAQIQAGNLRSQKRSVPLAAGFAGFGAGLTSAINLQGGV